MSENLPTAAVAEKALTDRAERQRRWGAGLLAVAALLWLYAAFEVFTPYTSDLGQVACPPIAVADRGALYDEDDGSHDEAVHCARTRDWGGPLGALALSSPFGTAGAVLLALGTATLRLREHENALAVIRLKRR